MIEFGPFRYDTESRSLYRGDEEIMLPPRVLAVLESLLERPGKIVTKKAILESAWEGAFVGEDSLTQAISQLRTALGDDPQRPEYIQTIPRRGYRFVAGVSERAGDVYEHRVAEEHVRTSTGAFRTVAFVLVAGLALLALGSWVVSVSRAPGLQETMSRPIPLTSYPGIESEPALSSDGQWVAFIWDRGRGGVRQLYLKSVEGGAEPRPLTEGTVHHHSPTWSPDGTRIAVVREAPGEELHEVISVSPMEGHSEVLGTIHGVEEHRFGVAWSPNADFLAVVHREAPGDPNAIFLLEISTRDLRRVTSPPSVVGSPVDDGEPAFSPDGRSIAFIRFHRGSGGEGDLYVQALDGKERLLYSPPAFAWDVDWTADGEAVVLSAGTTFANSRLVQVPVNGEAPTELAFGDRARGVSVARETGALAYSKHLRDPNIWRVNGPNGEVAEPKRLIASTMYDDSATYSPDGARIAFISDREGTWEVWVSRADGSDAQRLTDLGHAIYPSWSPSGTRIAFSSVRPGTGSRVYTIDAQGGPAVQLPFDRGEASIPSWAADEEWIYLQSQTDSDDYQVWKVPVRGDEMPVQLTHEYGMVPREGPNGRIFYWLWGNALGIWSLTADGGDDPFHMVDKRVGYDKWCLWEGQLVYIHVPPGGNPTIEMFDLETRETTEIVSLPPGTLTGSGLSVSPDGKWILYSQIDHVGADLMLMQGF